MYNINRVSHSDANVFPLKTRKHVDQNSCHTDTMKIDFNPSGVHVKGKSTRPGNKAGQRYIFGMFWDDRLEWKIENALSPRGAATPKTETFGRYVLLEPKRVYVHRLYVL